MKKTFSILITVLIGVIFVLTSCASNETVINNTNNNNPDTENFRIIKIETTSNNESTIETFLYNDNNQILENLLTTQDGTIISKIENTYNDEGKLIKKTFSVEKIITETTYTYNEQGLLAKEVWTGAEGSGVTTYKYDEKGRQISIVGTNDTPEIMDDEYYSANYTYDDKDRVIKEVTVQSHFPALTIEYTYNKQDKLVKESADSEFGDWSWESIYIYDKNGNLIKEEYSSSDNQDSTSTYKYKDGLLIESIYEGKIEYDDIVAYSKSTEKNYYDKNGKLIKKEYTNYFEFNSVKEYEEDLTTTYIYDEYGNLIEENKTGKGEFGDYDKTIKYYYESY